MVGQMRRLSRTTALCAAFSVAAGLCLAAGAAFSQEPGPAEATAAAPAPETIGPDSQLPVPRYASLKAEGANARRGPSMDQPITWIYQRPGLPLQITGESGPWRRVRDPDGAETWMHRQNLEERRTVYVRRLGHEDAALRSSPRPGGRPVAYLAEGVVGRLTACEGGWRRVAVGGRVGWVRSDALWAGEDCLGI